MRTIHFSLVVMILLLVITSGGCNKKPQVAQQKVVAAKTITVAAVQHTHAAKTKPVTDHLESHSLKTRAPSYFTATHRAQTRTVAAGSAATPTTTQEIILSAPPNTILETPLSTAEVAQIQEQLQQQRLNLAKGESNLEQVETPRKSPRLSARSIIVQPQVNYKN